MLPEQWERVKDVLDGALDLPPAQRADFVRSSAAGDSRIEQEVMSLLKESGEAFVAKPADQSADTETFGAGLVLDERYRLEKRLGGGGFADAWLAADLALHGRMVVLKIVKQNEDDWFQESFAKELRALSRIDHPGVVQPLGAGRLRDGRPYIVMQYVAGRTLGVLMAEGPLEFTRLARLLRKMGSAVEAAHLENVFHCDLKPDNIMVQELADGTEEPRLIDFGIARIRRWATESLVTVHIAGTLTYMAPEQLAGKAVSATDTFTLAVIAYEMITGQKPFAARDAVALQQAQRAGAVPPSRLRQGLTEEIDRVLLKALSFDSANRFARVREFTDQLAAALERAASVGQTRRSGAAWVLAAGAALALAAGAVVYIERSPAMPKRVDVQAAQVLGFRVIPARASTTRPLFVRDGAYVIDGGFRLEFQPQSSGHLYLVSERAEHPEGMSVLFPSPKTNGGASYIAAGARMQAPEKDWFDADPNERQRLWVVWSPDSLPELEGAGRWVNQKDGGAIGDRAAVRSIRSILAVIPRASASLLEGGISLPRVGPAAAPIDFEAQE